MHLSDLDSSKRSVSLAGDRSGRAVKPVRDELLGVVLADSYGAILLLVSPFRKQTTRNLFSAGQDNRKWCARQRSVHDGEMKIYPWWT